MDMAKGALEMERDLAARRDPMVRTLALDRSGVRPRSTPGNHSVTVPTTPAVEHASVAIAKARLSR
jgi:hypothetical protein